MIKKKKIVSRKKSAKRKVKASKNSAEMPENVYGQKIELAQEITPQVLTIIEQEEAKEPEEAREPQIQAEETELQQSEELMPVKTEKDLSIRQKAVLMYIAISCIMGVVSFFWIISVKNSFGQSFKETDEDNEISAFINDIKNGFNNAGDIINSQAKQVTDFTAQAKSIIIQEQLKNEAANKLKDQLQNFNLNTN